MPAISSVTNLNLAKTITCFCNVQKSNKERNKSLIAQLSCTGYLHKPLLYMTGQIKHTFWLLLCYDLLEDRGIAYVTINNILVLIK